jgi:rhodanese-related sulfurtransferase
VTRLTVGELLAEARRGLHRLDPPAAARAQADGALLLDIRSVQQRSSHGRIPGALWVPRNVLEWRVDPSSGYQHPRIADALGHDLGGRLVVFCQEGFQSSLAAATLQRLGIGGATDVVGGYMAWRAAGLPVLS